MHRLLFIVVALAAIGAPHCTSVRGDESERLFTRVVECIEGRKGESEAKLVVLRGTRQPDEADLFYVTQSAQFKIDPKRLTDERLNGDLSSLEAISTVSLISRVAFEAATPTTGTVSEKRAQFLARFPRGVVEISAPVFDSAGASALVYAWELDAYPMFGTPDEFYVRPSILHLIELSNGALGWRVVQDVAVAID